MNTADVVEDILEHHGVLGMRWGHRSERSGELSPRKQRKIAKKDVKFEKRANQPVTKIALHNSINAVANKDIERINNKPEYAAAAAARTLLSSAAPVTQKYHKEVIDSYMSRLNEAANELTNASGTKKYAVVPSDDDFLGFNVHTVDVKHGEIPDLSFRVNFVKDSNGMITGFVLAKDDVAQSAIDDILAHHGVKGMRWGHRSDRGSGSPSRRDIRRGKEEAATTLRIGKTKKDFQDARKDAKWLKETHGANLSIGRLHGKTTQKIVKDASKSMKPEIKALNKSPEFSTREAKRAIRKAKGTYQPTEPIAKSYHKAVSDIYMKHVKAASEKHMQDSPSGKWQDEFREGKSYWYIGLKKTGNVTHAGISDPDVAVLVRPIFDEEGYIVDFEDLMNDSMSQSSLFIDDILEHHGVLGMRWGVRRKATVGPQEVIVSDNRKKLKTSGGTGHPSHSDAVNARTSGQIAKKSGVKSLSNKQLEDYNKRVNLEQNFKRLSYHDKPAAQRFALKLLGQTGKQTAQNAANEVASQQVKKALIKAALVAA